MTEQCRHEWARTLGGTIRCAVCGDSMSQKEELRRINATERLEETNKGLFNIIKTYHPAYLDGCECPQCGDMPIYFDDVAYADTLEATP